MKRSLTNPIRWVLDELIPPVIRDSRIFMFPFFCLAYRTWSPRKYMDFKSNVSRMDDAEYARFYNELNSVSRNRATDNNRKCIEAILAECAAARDVLDVGCGHGHVLHELRQQLPAARLAGVDLVEAPLHAAEFEYRRGQARQLPFADGEFGVVLCTHVLEHVKDPAAVVRELLRVARDKLIVVLPKQRPYYFTLDEHINFFFYQAQVSDLVPGREARVCALDGDWLMVVGK